MRHKLMQVMTERDRAHPLGGIVELDDAYLGGERSGASARGGAPGKTPFVAAVETNEQGIGGITDLSPLKGMDPFIVHGASPELLATMNWQGRWRTRPVGTGS